MKLYTPTAAALAGAAIIVAAAATAHAEPGTVDDAAINATDHGVVYTVTNPDGRSAAAHTANGRFVANAETVALVDGTGATVTTIPLGLPTTSGMVDVAASISEDGRTLTLTPQSATHPIDEASDIEARKQHNAGIGALVGAGIGAVLGFFLGGVGALVTVPICAGIGALIGYSTP
ncbi:hypothetical protein C5E45_20390 [Nocardia nova]|uniref:DUF8020 domain-containing protein n=1 Tax=Nocardia nova TaxID=37330 RepID=A0A2S6AMG0_9NOCA|nr:hypothetical protein [Nocardia nova]PPJ36410.1 hypothetical protein C5E45_20390 [Nocardia nova]